MFKISLDPKRGLFVIKLVSFGIFWRTIKQENQDGRATDRTFKTYQDASNFVDSIGLRTIYRDYHESTIHSLFRGNEAAYQREAQAYTNDYTLPRVVRSNRG